MASRKNHPIIYVRGFAATQSEIEETVADPYMGFNIGSTKARTAWDGKVRRFFFESPLVRLMSEHKYEDVFVEGDDILASDSTDRHIPYSSIIIYRYYDDASEDFGHADGTPPIEHFARGLNDLILRLRDRVCANPANAVAPADFRVHLVAHSMGGLVCRAFLQHPELGTPEARAAVDKLFTYATPHNGIDLRIVRNVPGWLTFGDVNNFNRDRMAGYLAVPPGPDVSVLRNIPADRVFNLVGTNPRDYVVAGGFSAWAAGDASDGLVRIENATTHGPADGKSGPDVTSPRAFVHRSHSGHYGIVNSEEGYQNLARFLFGNLRVDGILDIDDITLPAQVQKEYEAGRKVEASYQFEVAVAIRGCQWQMTRREARENSAIFRKYPDLFPGTPGATRPPDRDRSPHLFSVFLDSAKSVVRAKSAAFAVDLRILVPDYQVAGRFFGTTHYEGSHILRTQVVIETFYKSDNPADWAIKYGFQEKTPGRATTIAPTTPITDAAGTPIGIGFAIPIHQPARPGFKGTLRIAARSWD
jgi:pimeloyl-ACP methyl ester carboxylesterase